MSTSNSSKPGFYRHSVAHQGYWLQELQQIFIPIFHSIQVQSIEEGGRQDPGLGTLIISKRSISPASQVASTFNTWRLFSKSCKTSTPGYTPRYSPTGIVCIEYAYAVYTDTMCLSHKGQRLRFFVHPARMATSWPKPESQTSMMDWIAPGPEGRLSREKKGRTVSDFLFVSFLSKIKLCKRTWPRLVQRPRRQTSVISEASMNGMRGG